MDRNLVKVNLTLFIPALIDLVDDNDFPWDKIDKLFSKKLKTRIRESGGETILIEATIYDIIIEAKKANKSAIGLLDFLNKLFEELASYLSKKEKLLIRSNIKHMLTSFDKRYLNYVGEIATLNNLIKSKAYRLNATEVKLPNGKTIDFSLEVIGENRVILIEVQNIHLDSERIEPEPAAIQKFLAGRFEQKLSEKGLNLFADIQFYLIPVLWGGWKDIKIFSDYYKSNPIHMRNVIEPISYLQYSDSSGYYEHYFRTVSSLFKD